jgi:class 3 adenylate cyclase
MRLSWLIKNATFFAASTIPVALGTLLIAWVATRNLGVWPSLPFALYRQPSSASLLAPEDVAQLDESVWQTADPLHMLAPPLLASQYWLRVTVEPDSRRDPIVASMSYLLSYGADFYLQPRPGAALAHVASSTEAATWAANARPSVRIVPSTERQTLYIKVEARAFWSVSFSVLTEADFRARTKAAAMATDYVIGCMLGAIGACLLLFVILRQAQFAYLAGVQVFCIVALASVNGSVLTWLPVLGTSHRLLINFGNTSLLLATYLAIQAFLQHLRLDDQNHTSMTARMLRRITALLIVILPLLPDSPRDHAMGLGYLALVGVFLQRIAADRRLDNALFLANAGLPLMLVIVTATAAWTGYLPASVYLDLGSFLGAPWLAAIMMIDVARRMRRLRAERRRTVELLQATSTGGDGQGGAPLPFPVSIMFVDMVGFSAAAEATSSRHMFDWLAARIQSMVAIIEREGGVIDRSLGDGLLCYFPAAKTHHARRAFDAARAIQRLSAPAVGTVAAADLEVGELPVRIGIHSDQVLIGNMGGSARVDFTMVGQGVVLASRIEQACAPRRIMLSQASRDLLVADGVASGEFVAIRIPIKHQTSLMPAYEHNPSPTPAPALRRPATGERSQAFDRRDARFAITNPPLVRLRGEAGEFVVHEFSLNGFKATSMEYLARGSIVELSLATGVGELDRQLEDKLLEVLTVEVRWSRASSEQFEHGFRVVGDGPAAGSYRMSVLQQHPGAALTADAA